MVPFYNVLHFRKKTFILNLTRNKLVIYSRCHFLTCHVILFLCHCKTHEEFFSVPEKASHHISDGIPELPPGPPCIFGSPRTNRGKAKDHHHHHHHHSPAPQALHRPPARRAGRAPIQIQVPFSRNRGSLPSPVGVLVVPVPPSPAWIGDPSEAGFDPFLFG